MLYSIGHPRVIRSEPLWETDPAWNLAVRYVDEGADLRGTAGALRLALDLGATRGPILCPLRGLVSHGIAEGGGQCLSNEPACPP